MAAPSPRTGGLTIRSRAALALVVALSALAASSTASASPSIKYGIQDDAWLAYGPGTLSQRLGRIDRLGVQIVRYTLRWDRVSARRPPAYDWKVSDAVLRGLRARGIEAVVTIWGTPAWANRDRAPSYAPSSGSAIAAFARAAARRYSWVRRWTIWNEPNQRRWLKPTTPATYVRRLLNPAYAAVHAAHAGALVAGGVTAPRGNAGGVAPVDWIHGMASAGARLDAYAHNPYPLKPTESPWAGGCAVCRTLTMATLPRLLGEVQRAFGPKRIWLTEYGYQTNPPDRFFGVSDALQAAYVGAGALRAYRAARVDMLIHFLVRDEPDVAGWQSGLIDARGHEKPSYRAFSLPLAVVSRTGARTAVWGQVRPGSGRRPYRLQRRVGGRWTWLGATARTSAGGFFQRTVSAGKGAQLRVWSPQLRVFSPPLAVL